MSIAVLYGVRWWRLHTRPWELVSVRQVGTALWELDLAPKPNTPELDYSAGQFVWMTVSPRLFPLFDHPFSIASTPRRSGLKLVIKEVGDFTRAVGQLAPGTTIGLDGPHGAFTIDGRSADAILLVAGGVGIAPILGLLRDLVERGERRPVRLIYGAGSPDKIIARDEIEAAAGAIDLKATLVTETADEQWPYETGTIDRRRLERSLAELDRSRTLAMICGPDPMITAVADKLLELGLPSHNVVYERFDYSGRPASRQDRRQGRFFALVGAALAAAVVVFALR